MGGTGYVRYNVNEDAYTTSDTTGERVVWVMERERETRCPYCGMERERCGCGYLSKLGIDK